MKKFLALLLVVVMAFAVTSCSLFNKGPVPSLDLEGIYKDYKEEKDYSVTYISVDDEDYEAMKDYYNLEGKGLKATLYLGKYEGKDDDRERVATVSIAEFANEDFAKLNYKQMKEELKIEKKELEMQIEKYEYMLENFGSEMDKDEKDDMKEDLEDAQERLLEIEEDWSFGIDGCFVWQGNISLLEEIAEK